MTRKEAKQASRHTAGMAGSTQTAAPEDYRHMIAQAAYYRALARGFQGGDPVEDWLQAEQEIGRRRQGNKLAQE